jgi:transposase InsO family protein
MDALKPPEALVVKSGNVSASWERFEEQLDWYVAAQGIGEAEDARRVAILLTVGGREAQELYKTFEWKPAHKDAQGQDVPEENKLRYKTVKQKFKEHCCPKKNEVIESYIFNKKVQEEGESFDCFLTHLRLKAATCGYKDQTDRMIRDRIVLGVYDKGVQEKLLRHEGLTLDKAIQICKAAEVSRLGSEQLNNAASVNAINRQGKFKSIDQRQQVSSKPNNPQSQKQEAVVKTYDCARCGTAHEWRRCPAWRFTCAQCKKQGHYTKCCFKKVQVVESEAVDNVDSQSDLYTDAQGSGPFFVGVIKAEMPEKIVQEVQVNTNSKWEYMLPIHNKLIHVKLDTGAGANLLGWQDYCSLDKRPKLSAAHVNLQDYNRKPIATKGSCIARVEVRGKSVPIQFVVVENTQSLLGGDTCDRLGLVQRIDEIQMKESPSCSFEEEAFPEMSKMSSLPFKYEIKVDPSVEPVIRPPRRVPVCIKDGLKEELDRMEKIGVIEKQTEPTAWVSESVCVKKPNGKIRVCIDPGDLNVAIRREHYPLPTREEIFSQIQEASVFSKLDASQAFWQIPLTEKSKHYTCFNTPFGRYVYTRLPYGLASSPEVFHRSMETMFGDIDGCRVYMDDILVWGKDDKQHEERLTVVKQRIDKYGLIMNWDKCELNKKQVTFIGETLSIEGVSPDDKKVEAINRLVKPGNKEELQRALGLINYVGRFIPNLAARCSQLRKLLKDSVEWHWEAVHDQEWNELKEIMISKPVLAYFDPNKVTKLSTDASKDGIGVVLLQKQQSGNWHPVAYGAKSMSVTEQRYAQIEKELLALVYGCVKFHQYVYGLKNLILETDHKPLISIAKKPLNELTPRLQRLMIKLQRYQFKIEWCPGKYLVIADTLSRSVDCVNVQDIGYEAELAAQSSVLLESLPATKGKIAEIVRETDKDPVLVALKRCIMNGWPRGKCMAFANVKEDLCVVNGLIIKGEKIVIPTSMRKEMLNKLHIGHLGAEKQKRLARGAIYWPGINKDIDDMSNKCGACLKYRPSQGKELMASECVETWGPWERVGTDLFTWGGCDYLIAIDYHSNYPEIAKLESTTSSSIILHLKSIFARHGIPRILMSDNGPQYASLEFKNFARVWGIDHRTSSPYYPQSNGKAERGVGIIKSLLNKSKESNEDPYLALLAYRSAPMESGHSPAELLMGRKLNCGLPSYVVRKYEYKSKDNEELLRRKVDQYNGHAKDLPPLQENDRVRVQDANTKRWSNTARVVKQVAPRSYEVETDSGGLLRRNRRALIKSNETRFNNTSDQLLDLEGSMDLTEPENTTPVSGHAEDSIVGTPKSPGSPKSSESTGSPEVVTKSSRSGRTIKSTKTGDMYYY